jgi:hypothetical protein
MSDVEKRIEQWRRALGTSDTFGAGDLDELESHLREEMERLQPLGLSDAESFLVARQRLGATEALEMEFEKVNTDRRSLLRLSWMAAGVLVYILAGHIAVGISYGGMLAALPLHVGPAALALIGVATTTVTAAALLAIVWTCVRRSSGSRLTGRLWTLSWPRRVGLLGGLVVVEECLALGFEILFRTAAIRSVSIEEFGWMWLIRSYANLGWIMLAPLLVGLLALVLWSRADHCRPAASGPC